LLLVYGHESSVAATTLLPATTTADARAGRRTPSA